MAIDAPFCVINGGDLRANGYELEFTYVPTAGLTFAGSLACNDAHYTKVNPALRALDGTFVPNYTPKWTGTFSVQYSGPEMDSLRGAHVVGRAEVIYASKQNPVANSSRPIIELGKLPARALVNVRLGLAGIQVGDTEVEFAGYTKNLTDNKSMVCDCDCGAVFSVNYQRARTYGVDLTVGF